ncbi:MAG: DNA polymerase III subunit delta, partial [Candidatus Dormibacteria bacterium]
TAGKRSPQAVDKLLGALAARADTTATCLVVRSLLASPSVLAKGVRGLGGEIHLVPRPTGRELRGYVDRRIEARRLNLEMPVVRLLLDVAAQDLGWLEMELDKLELYGQGADRVGEAEAMLLVTAAPPTELYRVTDALFESPGAVGPRLRAVLGRADVQPPAVVGALARTLRELIDYSDPQAGDHRKAIPAWRQERLSRQLSRAGRERIQRWLVALADLDWETRTGAVDAGEGLETLLARMAVEIQESRRARGA